MSLGKGWAMLVHVHLYIQRLVAKHYTVQLVNSPNSPDPGQTLYVHVHVSRCAPSQEFSLIIFMIVTTIDTYRIVHMNPNMQSVHFLIDK